MIIYLNSLYCPSSRKHGRTRINAKLIEMKRARW
jgi:hypothetical protein